ncbi:MAG: cohesin domain-containing protein [Patescibacteria group bacterium]
MPAKKILTRIGLLTIAITIPLVVLNLQYSYEPRKRALVSKGPASLSLTSTPPTESTLLPGEELTVTINLDPGGEDLYGFETTISYDTAIFEAISSEVNTDQTDLDFPLNVKNQIENGTIQFVRSINPGTNLVSSAGSIGTFKLRVRESAPQGDSNLSFVTAGDITCTVYNKNIEDVLGEAKGTAYTIEGENAAPTASITAPQDETSFQEKETINFQGTGVDREDGNLSGDRLTWHSSIDGELGTGTNYQTSSLSIGEHTITLTAMDSSGKTGTDSINLTITEEAQLETLTISPTEVTLQTGEPQIITATAYRNDGTIFEEATDTDFSWSLSEDIGTLETNYDSDNTPKGQSRVRITNTKEGSGTITVSLSHNNISKEKTTSITVTENAQPLTCKIIEKSFTIEPKTEKALSSSVSGGTTPYNYNWSADKGTLTAKDSAIARLEIASEDVNNNEKINISLTVTDSKNNTCTDTVTATIKKETAILNFNFSLTGRKNRSQPTAENIKIFARQAGSNKNYETAAWKKELSTSSAYGTGIIQELALGSLDTYAGKTYEFLLKPKQHLQIKSTNTVKLSSPGVYNITFPEAPAGDINEDNKVDSLDISIWIQQAYQEGEALTADINRDRIVDALDLSLILPRLNRKGAQ